MPINLIKPTVLFTDHSINQYISKCFAYDAKTNLVHVSDFSDFNHSIAVYGYLRGTGEAIKKSKDFWYIDHGYFKQTSRSFKNNRIDLKAWAAVQKKFNFQEKKFRDYFSKIGQPFNIILSQLSILNNHK